MLNSNEAETTVKTPSSTPYLIDTFNAVLFMKLVYMGVYCDRRLFDGCVALNNRESFFTFE